MKKQILYSTLLFISTFGAWADAEIKFTKMIHDFGLITQGKNAEYVFEFENTGDDTLVLQNVRPGCGCTTPRYSTQPIPPGETGEIQVIFNSTGKHGEFNKTVTITSNAINNQEVIYIRGVIVEPNDEAATAKLKNANIALDREVYKIGQIENSTTSNFEITVKNTGSDTLKIIDVKSGCQCIKYSFNQTNGVLPGQSGTLKLEYTPREIGPIESIIVIRTNSKNSETKNLLVTGTSINSAVPTSIMLNQGR